MILKKESAKTYRKKEKTTRKKKTFFRKEYLWNVIRSKRTKIMTIKIFCKKESIMNAQVIARE